MKQISNRERDFLNALQALPRLLLRALRLDVASERIGGLSSEARGL
ncbi:MAG: hypothetical protein JW999_07525 [Methanotrichaceae archaeon]|nr:hypothetical protein [Methanotrichaceae archaeon]